MDTMNMANSGPLFLESNLPANMKLHGNVTDRYAVAVKAIKWMVFFIVKPHYD